MLAYGGTWAKKPTAGMPALLTAISTADSAAAGTRSRPSGPAMVPAASSPSSEAVAITGTGIVWATAPGTAPRLIHCETSSWWASNDQVGGQLLPAQVGLRTRQDQQVTAADGGVPQRQLRPAQRRQAAVQHVQHRPPRPVVEDGVGIEGRQHVSVGGDLGDRLGGRLGGIHPAVKRCDHDRIRDRRHVLGQAVQRHRASIRNRGRRPASLPSPFVKLGYGLITCQRPPGDPRSDADLYQQAVELAVEAERLGYDSVWLTEHHFVDDGYMPSLMAVAAAIAVRTQRILIGTGLVLAPLHDPVRLAEDAATVDLLSRGRLLLGLGMGWRREEFEGLLIPMAERRARLIDAVRVLRQSWGDGLVTGSRKRPRPQVSVRPKPYRPGGPPIWIGAVAEPAVRRAGRIADGYMSGDISAEGFAEQVGWVRDELPRRELAGEPELSLYQATLAAVDGDAWERVRDHRHYLSWKYDDMDEATARTGPSAEPPPLTAEAERELRELTLAGTPEQVAEQIGGYRDAAGDGLHFVAQLYWPGMPYPQQQEAMRVFAEQVAPRLRG